MARLASLAMLALALWPAVPAQADVRTTGYLPARDGTLLHYDLHRPAAEGRFPTVLLYSGYGDLNGVVSPAPYVSRGYAWVLLSMRGTGCSEGVWRLLGPTDGPDGYDAVEWVADQPWSDGDVAMVGGSYGGIVQPYVAAERPPHLRAIAPIQPLADLYRDAAYPGGIPNVGLAGFLGTTQKGFSAVGTGIPLAVADEQIAQTCAAAQARRPENQLNDPLLELRQHSFDDAELQGRSLSKRRLRQIDVPVFADWSTPDNIVGPRGIEMLRDLRVRYHAVFGGGGHVAHEARLLPRVLDFLDHYVRGVDNGFEEQPALELWWDVRTNGQERWRTAHDRWPPREAEPRRLHLSQGGRLQDAPGTGAPDTYAYLGGTGQQSGLGVGTNEGWQVPAMPGGHLVYETAPLAQDLLTTGPASVDLWLSSTAADTDVEVTLTEVRPNGDETYLQQGWLRASHRKLDPARSSATRPFHTHRERDAEALPPGRPSLLRVELLPFLHAFRAGHRIRLYVEAPNAVPQMWSFDSLPGPAVNSVHHDGLHQSALVLPALEGQTAQAPAGSCVQAGRTCRDFTSVP